jgi:NADP-dependent 3-hydroxy acid dehydrogenase YdfG
MLEESQIESMVKQTVEKWGRVDYAVNAAGN